MQKGVPIKLDEAAPWTPRGSVPLMASQCIMYAVWVPVLPPGARQVHDSFSDYYGDLLEGQYGCPDRIVLNGAGSTPSLAPTASPSSSASGANASISLPATTGQATPTSSVCL